VLKAAGVVNINISKAVISVHEKCKLQVSIMVLRLEAAGMSETNRR
jgi:hypothetical protein